MNWLKSNWLPIVIIILVAIAGTYIYKEMKEKDSNKKNKATDDANLNLPDNIGEMMNGNTGIVLDSPL